ncbi:MAG TPA: formylmethanofuran dehydrogenase subunit C [Candidatus Polarisedimenticolia bacterium]|jgi:formylmethanofuran dehydrogenase subunit C|nr:formylmethanofuran dehydrogenase subunit C [Candidatus Polarisedimenticolia bacterium]
MNVRLTLRPATLPEGIPVDGSCLCPDRIAGLDAAAVARLPVLVGNRREALGDLFSIEVAAGTGAHDARGAGGAAGVTLEIEGDLRRFERIGAGMTAGRLLVRGDAGDAVGSGQKGGGLRITGAAGVRAGEGHRGGALLIDGCAGDDLGAPLPGSPHGIAGGVLLARGGAGPGAARRMRRGIVVIGADCGEGAGLEMLAGTLILLGPAGPGLGALMKRGTIVAEEAFEPLPVFAPSGEGRFSFLRLYHDALVAAGVDLPRDFADRPRRRFVGDVSGGGLGEILTGGR